jgi:hypothetical protein
MKRKIILAVLLTALCLFVASWLYKVVCSLPGAYRALKSNGTATDMFWKKDATHFVFFVEQDEILEFLNKHI